MYGTRSGLEARFTIESGGGESGGGGGGGDGGLLFGSLMPPAPPMQMQMQMQTQMPRPPLTNIWDPMGVQNQNQNQAQVTMQSNAYLQLLQEARREAEEARGEVNRMRNAKDFKDKGKPKPKPRSKVTEQYEKMHKTTTSTTTSKENVSPPKKQKEKDTAKQHNLNASTASSNVTNESYDVDDSFASYHTEGEGEGAQGGLQGSLSLSQSLGNGNGNGNRNTNTTNTAGSSLFGTKVTFGKTTMNAAEGLGLESNENTENNLNEDNKYHNANHNNYNYANTARNIAHTGTSITDPASMSLLALQGMFRRQLQAVKRSVEAAKQQYVSGDFRTGGVGGANHGGGAFTYKPSPFDYTTNNISMAQSPSVGVEAKTEAPSSTPRSKKMSTNSNSNRNRNTSSLRKSMKYSDDTSSSRIKKTKDLEYWKALMMVDASLTKKEAKKIAKMQKI